MIFQVDFQAGKPVYLQLADQIRYAAASGKLRAGEALPSLRPWPAGPAAPGDGGGGVRGARVEGGQRKFRGGGGGGAPFFGEKTPARGGGGGKKKKGRVIAKLPLIKLN